MTSAYYEVYRGSPLGIALLDTLDEYVRDNVVDQNLGIMVMQEFDRALASAIATKVRATASVKAHFKTYRHCEEVWNFTLRNATFKMDDKTVVTTGRIKIIACKDANAVDSVPTPQQSIARRTR
ncbi:transcription initiation factor IIA gamma subunit [Mycena sanguinolenta]|nr:transcription initiation factor IIA gamma subunit [Mycena sanguinolenta]